MTTVTQPAPSTATPLTAAERAEAMKFLSRALDQLPPELMLAARDRLERAARNATYPEVTVVVTHECDDEPPTCHADPCPEGCHDDRCQGAAEGCEAYAVTLHCPWDGCDGESFYDVSVSESWAEVEAKDEPTLPVSLLIDSGNDGDGYESLTYKCRTCDRPVAMPDDADVTWL